MDPGSAWDGPDLGDPVLPRLLQVAHRVPPVVINFLSIVISMGWTTATFTVSG
ncbi:MAG: hypothetical protein JO139_14385 [Alphaproteobacteria bacterium]|nr:hypothetical protein [Alphaproteobacteria bacterium]